MKESKNTYYNYDGFTIPGAPVLAFIIAVVCGFIIFFGVVFML